MADTAKQLPSLVSIVGVDGSGKTTLANWLVENVARQGGAPVLVWSRFRNYLSKPLLALTRMTGHNHYETHDGIRFGFHDFEGLVGYRELFALLQAVDVNVAAYFRIHRRRRNAGVVICERGPWDTLVDVTADTGLEGLPGSMLGAAYTLFMRRDARVLWIRRDRDRILETRPELAHDYKLQKRIDIYEHLSKMHDWVEIDNNGSLDSAKSQIAAALGIDEGGQGSQSVTEEK